MNYTDSTPDTEPATDWRKSAACRKEEPDLFFPKGHEGPWLPVIEQAKAICRRCPSADACLQFALDNSIGDGIFGGLTADERKSLRRSVNRGRTAQATAAAKAARARQAGRPRTFQTLLEDNTTRLYGGHLAWTGGQQTSCNGRSYTPKQIAFIADRGRHPEGVVLPDCGNKECVLPAHLTDQSERGLCGTLSGYRRHLEEGSETCPPCRKANSNADARLRRTGTAKVLTS